MDLTVRAFPPEGRPRVVAAQDGTVLAEARLAAGDMVRLAGEAGAKGGRSALALPDAASPVSLGLGEDARALSLGLVSVAVSRP